MSKRNMLAQGLDSTCQLALFIYPNASTGRNISASMFFPLLLLRVVRERSKSVIDIGYTALTKAISRGKLLYIAGCLVREKQVFYRLNKKLARFSDVTEFCIYLLLYCSHSF